MEWIVQTLRDNPSLAVFLTIGVGFFIGQLKYKSFSLGTVTSVLLVGVLVGQLDIPVPGPLKDVFFLLFLFSIGYSVGPQFFSGTPRRRAEAGAFRRRGVCVVSALHVGRGALHGL